MLMMLPLRCPCMTRTSCFMLRITPRTFVSYVAATLSAVWSVIGPTWPSVPALFTATSRRPNRATVLSTRLLTSSSRRTSAWMKAASAPKPRSSASRVLPSASRRPETTRRAPFFAKARAVARPIPVRAPVIKTTGLFISLLLFQATTLGSYCVLEKDFVSWGAYLSGMERYGVEAPALFRGRGRGRQPHDRRRAPAPYLPALAEPADSRSGVRGRGRAAVAQRSWRRADRCGQGLPRPRPPGADAGRCRGRSGTQGGATGKEEVRHRLPNRARDQLAAAGDACPARRAAEHRRHDLQRLFAGSRRGARPRPAGPGLHARGAGLRPRVPRGRPGAAHRPDAERPSPHRQASNSSA